MSITYNTTVKNNRLTQVLNAVDGGGAAGQLVIGTAALSGATGVLATVTLAHPSATVASGILTLSGVPIQATASAAGTAAKAELRDSTGATVASGLTVGTSGTDIIINNVNITLGETITLNSGSIAGV